MRQELLEQPLPQEPAEQLEAPDCAPPPELQVSIHASLLSTPRLSPLFSLVSAPAPHPATPSRHTSSHRTLGGGHVDWGFWRKNLRGRSRGAGRSRRRSWSAAPPASRRIPTPGRAFARRFQSIRNASIKINKRLPTGLCLAIPLPSWPRHCLILHFHCLSWLSSLPCVSTTAATYRSGRRPPPTRCGATALWFCSSSSYCSSCCCSSSSSSCSSSCCSPAAAPPLLLLLMLRRGCSLVLRAPSGVVCVHLLEKRLEIPSRDDVNVILL